MSRFILISVVMVSAAARADGPGGSWGGYVSGWQGNGSRPSWYIGSRNTAPYANQQYARYSGFYYGAPVSFPTPYPNQHATEQASAQQAAAQQYAAQQESARRDAEERLAAERRANDEYRARITAQELAKQEQAAQMAAQQLAAQQLAAQQASQQLVAQQLALQETIAQKQAQERAAQPYVKGNDVYRWVDDEGVTHYSTKLPHGVKASKE